MEARFSKLLSIYKVLSFIHKDQFLDSKVSFEFASHTLVQCPKKSLYVQLAWVTKPEAVVMSEVSIWVKQADWKGYKVAQERQ